MQKSSLPAERLDARPLQQITLRSHSKLSRVLLLGLAIAGLLHAEHVPTTPPFVRSGTALGNNLLERLAAAAEVSGYHVEIADVRAQSGGIRLKLLGLVLTPPAANFSQPIRLPVVIPMGESEKLLVSCRVITPPLESLPEGSEIRMVLSHFLDHKVIAERTTKLVRGWNNPTLNWVADCDWPAGEFVVEIIPVFSGQVKITLPIGLLLPAIKK